MNINYTMFTPLKKRSLKNLKKIIFKKISRKKFSKRKT